MVICGLTSLVERCGSSANNAFSLREQVAWRKARLRLAPLFFPEILSRNFPALPKGNSYIMPFQVPADKFSTTSAPQVALTGEKEERT